MHTPMEALTLFETAVTVVLGYNAKLKVKYLVEITGKGVDADIKSPSGFLKEHLQMFYKIDAAEFAKNHPQRAKTWLASLLANHQAAIDYGLWTEGMAEVRTGKRGPPTTNPMLSGEGF